MNNSSNLFGCIGLRGKEYCILNKQYTKEEYETLVPKIIEKMKADGERGEFFPAFISPFGYNETLADDYFPLTKEEALAKGFVRSDFEAPLPQAEKMIKGSQLPIDSTEVSEDILKTAIICEVSGRPFMLVKPELEFYRNHQLPLPRKHPDVRYAERMALRNPRALHLRMCDKCGKEMVSMYPTEDTRKIYSEMCYQQEIYG
ncbi:MAG: hypothetical protein LBG59_04305 [Candidatus Peribacteria bacterium]|nr:hypothetical protein [Candidatus Peribacteria bacterium]